MDSNTMDLARSLLRPDEISRFQQLSQQLQRTTSKQSILDSACSTSRSDSYWPLIAFCCIIESTRLPTFELCRSFWQCWTCLPEECKAGRGSDAAHQLIHRCLWLCNNSYESFIDLLHPSNTSPAIINPDTGRSITHQSLAQILSTFRLPIATLPNKAKPVVAISLPNGSLLATVLLATASYFTAAPVAYGNGVGAEQFKRDVLQSNSNLVIASAADVDRLELRSPWLAQAHIRVILVDFSSNHELTFTDLDGRRVSTSACPRPLLNRAGDIAILLFTSGTSGSKKLVPLHVESLVTGVAMVQSSWGLTSTTRCLNQMPLNHVGGIVRNLFAPIMSGGSVICCSGFDANSFWDIVDDHAPTWYYASPTMHQCILEAGTDRPESIQKSQINLVCNAAGALLPSLAKQLRDTFSKPGLECTVLPSYGMTECMPISTPPLTYKLEKTGTSGVSVGPEITILDGNDKAMKNGEVGRIAVRGAPVFAGYLKDGNLDRSCFTRDGWFDTGDMGYLDDSAFLYITGRSKEVINRGGELISPFEVEDAVLAAARNPDAPIFGRISKTLAFSVNHDVLQEVVGLIVVSPPGSLRPCLKTIQESTKSSLASVKQPVLLVFMNDDVPTNNNKVLRIKLAERLGLPTISDTTPSVQRYYEAICPPINTPLTTKIRCEFIYITHEPLFELCREAIPLSQDFCIRPIDNEITPELWLAPQERRDPVKWTVETVAHLQQKLAQSLDSYLVPSRLEYIDTPFIRRADGSVDADKLSKPKAVTTINPAIASGAAAAKIITAFAETLGIPADSLDESSDFFELGGDSMKAGRLLSALRKAFSTRLAIDVLFANSTVSALAALLGDKTIPESTDVKVQRVPTMPITPPGCDKTRSSTNIILLLVQLIPICIIAPMLRALTWSIFIYCLTYSQDLRTSDTIPGRFVNLVVSLLIGKTVTETVAPIIAVIFKWLVIGRYREGLYPMWGFYHTRWWFVEKVLSIGGMGIYEHFGFTRTLYYRSLGAQIGSRVVIDKDARLGEYDLISIGDDVVLDACTVRPFAAERNTSMYLGKIHIGMGASVGLKSIVAAGTIVPAGSCIGPNSSSWEVKDADEANRDLSASKIAKPNMVLEYMVGIPLTLLVAFIGAIPWMGGLMPLVITEPKQEQSDMLREVTIWFSSPYRVCFHYVALACNVTLGPIFFFLVVVLIKKMFEACCGGKVRPGPGKNRSQMDRLRMCLIRTLMPDKQFHKLTNLFGTHYAATSFFARMLGAKIGKHVYWPGKGPSTQDWDMLEIGDSVVFGSRSHIVTSDGTGTNRVKIGAASMVADRVVLLPGVELGERTVMGSGALSKRNKLYPADTTWVGSKENDAVCLKAETVKSNQISDPHLGHRADTYRQTLLEPVSLAEYINPSQRSSPAISRNNSSYDVESYSQEQWHAKPSRIHSLAKSTITVNSVSVESDDDVDGKKLIVHSNNSTPFARAFYQGLAPYRVWGQFTIALYSTFITILTAVFWNIHSITAIQVVAWLFKRKDYQKTFLRDHSLRPIFIYLFFAALIAIIMALQILIVLSTVVAAKWILMGRRKQGNYDWDKSSYCQRWQLFLKIESLRQKCYRGSGILGMLSGTYWIVLYFRALGATIGKDCALFASGTPSLYFTEPDLLTLGDRVSVDDASLVCHINTRGKFDLNPLSVGDRSVLRTGSRLLSGAKMENDTCLLEHTLVMAGDVVDAETTRQGWPSEEFKGNRLPTMRVAYHWEKVRK